MCTLATVIAPTWCQGISWSLKQYWKAVIYIGVYRLQMVWVLPVVSFDMIPQNCIFSTYDYEYDYETHKCMSEFCRLIRDYVAL